MKSNLVEQSVQMMTLVSGPLRYNRPFEPTPIGAAQWRRCTSPASQGDVIAGRRAALSEDGMHATLGVSSTLCELRTGA